MKMSPTATAIFCRKNSTPLAPDDTVTRPAPLVPSGAAIDCVSAAPDFTDQLAAAVAATFGKRTLTGPNCRRDASTCPTTRLPQNPSEPCAVGLVVRF